MIKNVAKLDAEVRKVCPIDGVDSTGAIYFRPEATDAQMAAAVAVVSQFQDALPNLEIDKQIIALESLVTQRRMREAIMSGDNIFIADIDAKIAALRAQRR